MHSTMDTSFQLDFCVMYFVSKSKLLLSDTAKTVTLSEIILKMVQKNTHLAFCEVQTS